MAEHILPLDPSQRSTDTLEFQTSLRSKIVGQEEGVQALVDLYQVFCAGLNSPGRPVGNLLFLGPTGSGKTRIVEAAAEILFGDARAVIKVDCAEFQHSHEIAKLIGSPPGYLGHRETHPLITQEELEAFAKLTNDEERDHFIELIWDRRNPDIPIKTPEQLVTLASIIEKETGRADERSRVAAVFVNRLRQKIKLQSDPTIIYGLVGGKGTLGRPIKRSEIQQPSPYNTYVVDGLPPGPIANPGRASLEAAANPARTRDLFFVADGTGGHAFSDSYDQHSKNVAKLRAMEKQTQNDTVEPADDPAAPAAANASASDTGAPAAAAKPVPAKKPARPAAPPPRQGAAASAPVVQQ